MIFDFSSSPVFDGVVISPEYGDIPPPTDPSQIKETIVIGGSSTGTSISVIGTTDSDQACTCN